MAVTKLKMGTVVDGFTIGTLAHKGGMAVFYEVTHPDHTAPLLMKVPVLFEGEDPAAIVGFEMEQMIMPRLSGPHVPKVIAVGSFSTQPYIVMERIPGETLYKKIDHLPLPPDEVASVAIKVATALQGLHQQHVIHLDVKPSNIIIAEPTENAKWIAKWKARPKELMVHSSGCLLDRDDITARIGEITCPALIIHGTHDTAISAERAEALRNGLRNADDIVWVQGAAHASNLTHPQIVNPPLRAFLERVA
jgi:serine/threonine protein kinase